MQVPKMKEKLMNIRQLLKKSDVHNPLIKVLLHITQNFTDQTAVAKVLGLLEDILTEISA